MGSGPPKCRCFHSLSSHHVRSCPEHLTVLIYNKSTRQDHKPTSRLKKDQTFLKSLLHISAGPKTISEQRFAGHALEAADGLSVSSKPGGNLQQTSGPP